MRDREQRFNENDVIVLATPDGDRAALITRVGGDGSTTDDSTIHYSFIESDGTLGASGYFRGAYQMKEVRKVDFATVRTVVELPAEWKERAMAYELAEAGKKAEQAERHGESGPKTHPSYGAITVTRRSGGGGALFGSPFRHQHFMSITISRAELHRSLANDRHHSRRELIEISLSEAQWARMVSSVGMGGGTPCTINAVYGSQMEECPMDNEVEKFHDDIRTDAAKSQKYIDEAIAKTEALIGGKTVTKAQAKEVLAELVAVKRRLTDSMPFIVEQLDERMETVVQDGKIEIEAYAHATIVQSGLQQLAKVNENVIALPTAEKKPLVIEATTTKKEK